MSTGRGAGVASGRRWVGENRVLRWLRRSRRYGRRRKDTARLDWWQEHPHLVQFWWGKGFVAYRAAVRPSALIGIYSTCREALDAARLASEAPEP
jgi:hypothetical protein